MKNANKRGFHDLGFAKVDLRRERHTGAPEVIYCQGKRPAQILKIAKDIMDRGSALIATRLESKAYESIGPYLPKAIYHSDCQMLTYSPAKQRLKPKGLVAVVCAGTSDIPVAEEAAVTAHMLGARVARIYDVGVAGLHRLLHFKGKLRSAHAVVAVAGMEGALPSVVGGLVRTPVIAVPTSVGYGTGLNGIAALLSMLNSCAPGVTVVNIDNGFGAGFAAARINRMAVR